MTDDQLKNYSEIVLVMDKILSLERERRRNDSDSAEINFTQLYPNTLQFFKDAGYGIINDYRVHIYYSKNKKDVDSAFEDIDLPKANDVYKDIVKMHAENIINKLKTSFSATTSYRIISANLADSVQRLLKRLGYNVSIYGEHDQYELRVSVISYEKK